MRQERLYRTEGIVLREMDYAEADRILTVLSPGGKRSLIAKGIRRPTSRKVGHLGLFYRAQMLVAKGANLDIVTQAESLEEFEGLRGDLVGIDLRVTGGDLIPLLTLVDSGGGVVALRTGAGSAIAIRSLRLPASDRYFLIVGRFGYAVGTTGGSYTLSLERRGASSLSGRGSSASSTYTESRKSRSNLMGKTQASRRPSSKPSRAARQPLAARYLPGCAGFSIEGRAAAQAQAANKNRT